MAGSAAATALAFVARCGRRHGWLIVPLACEALAALAVRLGIDPRRLPWFVVMARVVYSSTEGE